MNNKNIILLVVGLLVVGAGAYFIINNNSGTAVYTETSNPSPAQTPSSKPSKPVTVPDLTPAAPTVIHNVSIQSFAFSPASITIRKGESIVWKNMDSAPHTVTGGDLNSKPMAQNETYSFVYGKTGVFPYFCSLHPSMKGTVTVTN